MGSGRVAEYEWREVPGFPDYEVASLGYIRKTKTKVLHAINITGTTETVQLSRDGKRYHRTVKSIVLSAFPGALYP